MSEQSEPARLLCIGGTQDGRVIELRKPANGYYVPVAGPEDEGSDLSYAVEHYVPRQFMLRVTLLVPEDEAPDEIALAKRLITRMLEGTS